MHSELAKPAPPVQVQAQAKELLESISQAAFVEQCERQLIRAVAELAGQSETGLVAMGALGNHMHSHSAGFSAKKCGHTNLTAMVKALSKHMTMERRKGGDWVRPLMAEKRSA